MKTMRFLTVAGLTLGMMTGAGAMAQSAPNGTQTTTTDTRTSHTESTTEAPAAQPNWTVDQLITSSVHDAWVMSGRNEANFFQMVTALAQVSAQKRGLTLPDSEDAGKRFGQLVKDMAKTDHDQLLYVVVDKAVQQVATKS